MRADRAAYPDSRWSWVVAVVGAVAMVFTFGTVMSYGIFRQPFSDAFGISPVALSGVFAIMLFAFFIGSGLVGVFGSRLGSRTVLLACTAATGVVAPAPYFTGSLVGLVMVFTVLGLSLGTAFVLTASVVPRWFEARRGVATGLIFVGNGFGLFVLPPIWQLAIAELGVRQSFLAIMSVTTLAFLLSGLVCRRPPWAEQMSESPAGLLDWLTRLGGTRTFQLLFLGIGLSFGWYQLLAAYAVDLFASRGLTAAAASTAYGFIGGVSIISRIGGGYLADAMGSRQAFLVSLGSAALGIALLFVPAVPVLPIAIILLGLGLGGATTLYIPLLMGIYSPEKDTAIVGVFNIAIGISALVMPPLGTASIAYMPGFSLVILLTLAAAVVAIGTMAAGTAA
jgi:OFA family oxalate/formate antiporter-like MFS transporter